MADRGVWGAYEVWGVVMLVLPGVLRVEGGGILWGEGQSIGVWDFGVGEKWGLECWW